MIKSRMPYQTIPMILVLAMPSTAVHHSHVVDAAIMINGRRDRNDLDINWIDRFSYLPCCVPINANNPADKWFIKAFENTFPPHLITKGDGVIIEAPSATYEAIGPHFQGNPYGLEHDSVVRHGSDIITFEPRNLRSFDGLRDYLKYKEVEGIVFWVDGKPLCKIKRSDFGFEWPIKEET